MFSRFFTPLKLVADRTANEKFSRFSIPVKFSMVISFLLILTTLFGVFNLISASFQIAPTTALAQSLNTVENNSTQNPEISQETTFADINQVEFDDSSYNFGDRIATSKFTIEQIKNDICGEKLINTPTALRSPQVGTLAPKFNSNSASSVIKTVKSQCKNSANSFSNSNQMLIQLPKAG